MKVQTKFYFLLLNNIPKSLLPLSKRIIFKALDILHHLKNWLAQFAYKLEALLPWPKSLRKLLSNDKRSFYNRANRFVPPPSKVLHGTDGYLNTGREFFEYFLRFGGLKASHKVLDIGCGTGRMAVPLITFLDNDGSYDGIDVIKEDIDWASKSIGNKYDNFNFHQIDISNKLYNPNGAILGAKYKLPFGDNQFDFIFLVSVFTHMLSEDVANYLAEISRVLKPGGRCLITYFLLNDKSLPQINKGKTIIDFKHKYEDCLTSNIDVPEAAIAYDEGKIRSLYSEVDLLISDPISYGSWTNLNKYLSFQDVVVATKGIK